MDNLDRRESNKETSSIFVDYSPQKEAEIEALIAESQQRVEKAVEKALLLEREGIRREHNLKSRPFDSLQMYLDFLRKNGFINERNLQHPRVSRLERTIKAYLVRHWEKAKDQINLGINGVKKWEDFWQLDKFHSTPSGKITFASEIKMFPFELYDALEESDFYNLTDSYSRTNYATHTSPVTEILEEGRLYSPTGVNFACSSVVFRDRPDEFVYIFDRRDLLKAVPMVFGRSTSAGENEVTSWFPIPLGLTRGVIPLRDILKTSDGYLYHQGYYQTKLSPNMFSKKLT